MKIRTIGFTILFAWLMTSRLWADVGYELSLAKLAPDTAIHDCAIKRIQLDDRCWAAPGVEQASYPLPPPEEFDFANPPRRIRLEPAKGICHTSYLVTFQSPYCPSWLDKVAWPLTRQWFHRGEEGVFSFHVAVMH